MKIALVRTASNILTYGSYNIQEIGLAVALMEYGISTDVYARFSNIDNGTIVGESNGCQVVVRPLKGKRIYHEIMYYPALLCDLLSGGYDIVQCLDDSQMMLPFIFKELKKAGIKTIMWQGMYRNFAAKLALSMQMVYDFLFARSIDRNTDLKIAKTNYAKRYLEKKHYTNIITIPVGLVPVPPVDDIDLKSKVEVFRSKFKHTLLYVGAVENRRNPLFVLSLLKQLPSDIGLFYIGKGTMLEETKKTITDMELSERVFQEDRIENNKLKIVYDNADIFILPTNYEIYGMVIMEALQYGIPCISTPEAGPQTILCDKKLGCCINLDLDTWAEKILFYLNNYKSDEDKIYRTNIVEENYRWSKIAKRYQEILYNVNGKQMLIGGGICNPNYLSRC